MKRSHADNAYCGMSDQKFTAQQRMQFASELRGNKTYAEIGTTLGVTGERARQIIRKAQRNASLPAWTRGLEVQIAKVLLQNGFKSKSEVRVVLERGERVERIGTARLVQLRTWIDDRSE